MHPKSLGKSHGLMETVHAFISTWVSRRLCLALACRQAHTEDLKSSGGDRKKGSVSTEKERVNVNAWGRCIVRVTDVHQRSGIDLHAIHPETEMSMLIVILESVFPSGLPGGGGQMGMRTMQRGIFLNVIEDLSLFRLKRSWLGRENLTMNRRSCKTIYVEYKIISLREQ